MKFLAYYIKFNIFQLIFSTKMIAFEIFIHVLETTQIYFEDKKIINENFLFVLNIGDKNFFSYKFILITFRTKCNARYQ